MGEVRGSMPRSSTFFRLMNFSVFFLPYFSTLIVLLAPFFYLSMVQKDSKTQVTSRELIACDRPSVVIMLSGSSSFFRVRLRGPMDKEISGAQQISGSQSTIQRATLTNLQSVWSGSKDQLVARRTTSRGESLCKFLGLSLRLKKCVYKDFSYK